MAKSTGAKPMTKSAILERLSGDTELPKKKIGEVLEALINLSYSEAKKGFTIPGLGKLVLSNRKARMGRNPQTGEAIKIAARQVVRFRIGKQAKDAILGAKAPSARGGAKKPAAKAGRGAAKPAARATAARATAKKSPAKAAKKPAARGRK